MLYIKFPCVVILFYDGKVILLESWPSVLLCNVVFIYYLLFFCLQVNMNTSMSPLKILYGMWGLCRWHSTRACLHIMDGMYFSTLCVQAPWCFHTRARQRQDKC